MTFEDLGNIGEFVGAIGVVGSLIYLAFQIRQNTKSVRAAAFQEAMRDISALSELLAHDVGLNRIWFAATRDFESLDVEDQRRFASYMISFLRRLESLLYQTQQGILEPESWAGLREFLKYVFSQPGVAQWWKNSRNLFNPNMQEFIERELR